MERCRAIAPAAPVRVPATPHAAHAPRGAPRAPDYRNARLSSFFAVTFCASAAAFPAFTGS